MTVNWLWIKKDVPVCLENTETLQKIKMLFMHMNQELYDLDADLFVLSELGIKCFPIEEFTDADGPIETLGISWKEKQVRKNKTVKCDWFINPREWGSHTASIKCLVMERYDDDKSRISNTGKQYSTITDAIKDLKAIYSSN